MLGHYNANCYDIKRSKYRPALGSFSNMYGGTEKLKLLTVSFNVLDSTNEGALRFSEQGNNNLKRGMYYY
jgi:hypothetical protein